MRSAIPRRRTGPLAGFAPLLGVYGVSLAAALAAALLAAFAASPAWSRRRAALAVAFAALLAAGAALRLASWTEPTGAPVPVALLQGNVPQHLKWREDVRGRTLRDYYAQVVNSAGARRRPSGDGAAGLPRPAAGGIPRRACASTRAPRGKEILMGSVERSRTGDRFEYWNSVVRLGDGKAQSYRKRHLVPFGEFIPPGFGWVLAVLKIPLTDFARGDEDQPPLAAGGTTWAVAICYEDIFGEEVIASLPQAGVLLNVSNDAWFGESLAADQHLQFSQMRALETGRWMVRATNTGVTAAIDEKGRVVARLPQFTRGNSSRARFRTAAPRRSSGGEISPRSRWWPRRWGSSFSTPAAQRGGECRARQARNDPASRRDDFSAHRRRSTSTRFRAKRGASKSGEPRTRSRSSRLSAASAGRSPASATARAT